ALHESTYVTLKAGDDALGVPHYLMHRRYLNVLKGRLMMFLHQFIRNNKANQPLRIFYKN
ncbi:MAG: hypothetical protein IJO47_04780, partial [Clostridia bacterium]|nr:hypothetical protein [Clostridia bacterium]